MPGRRLTGENTLYIQILSCVIFMCLVIDVLQIKCIQNLASLGTEMSTRHSRLPQSFRTMAALAECSSFLYNSYIYMLLNYNCDYCFCMSPFIEDSIVEEYMNLGNIYNLSFLLPVTATGVINKANVKPCQSLKNAL